MIEAKINNCNNITSATIRLKKNYLNICYAMNGMGKSTIALAIKGCSEHNDLDFLHPFGSEIAPTCELSEEGLKVLLFNEGYVDQFVFQQSEVIQNSFEVFIKTPEYLAKQASIKEKLEKMHVNVSQNEDLQRIVSVGKLVKTKLPVTSTGGFRQSGTFKSLMSSASPYELPEELSKFRPLMERDYTVEWVAWKHDGTKYDSADICPFCSLDLGKEYESQKKKFADSYAKSDVKNRIEMLGYFHSVEEFMDTSSKDKLHRCIQGLETDEVTKLWITMFHHELDVLVGCITKIDNFNSHQVRTDDISKLDEQLVGLVIDKSNFRIFKSKRLEESVDSVNQIIEELRKETESLKQEIGELTSYIVSRSRDAIDDINDFLFTAGINYSFEIHPDAEDTSSTILKYKAIEPVEVEDIRLHLSWGERNAFALVLFMHDALSKQPDVIVLDDPISSFDRNKKYAIINRLFSSRRDSFFRKTVLMLTHDLQPIIDCLVNNKPHREFISACFLQNKEGVISEQEITPDDVKSITLLLSEHAKNEEYNKVHRVISCHFSGY
ncbi:MAG: AAA family ATPase [Candidatus Hodarchaeales archaeon]